MKNMLWKDLWRILRKIGWSWDFGKGKVRSLYFGSDSHYDKNSSGGQLGVHYFESEEQVRSFVQNNASLASVVASTWREQNEVTTVAVSSDTSVSPSACVGRKRKSDAESESSVQQSPSQTSPTRPNKMGKHGVTGSKLLEEVLQVLEVSGSDCSDHIKLFHNYLINIVSAPDLHEDLTKAHIAKLERIVVYIYELVQNCLISCCILDMNMVVTALRCMVLLFQSVNNETDTRETDGRMLILRSNAALKLFLSTVQKPWVAGLAIQTCLLQLIHEVFVNDKNVTKKIVELEPHFATFLSGVCLIFFSSLLLF